MTTLRAGTRTTVNKPGVDKRVDDKMDQLLEKQMMLEKAIEHYTKKIELDDWWKQWYSSALTVNQNKLKNVQMEINNASGYRDESAKTSEATSESIGAREGPPPAKEKVSGSKNR